MNMLYLITILTLVGLVLVVFDSPSRTYWEGVGPAWDQMLNPNKYKEQDNEGN